MEKYFVEDSSTIASGKSDHSKVPIACAYVPIDERSLISKDSGYSRSSHTSSNSNKTKSSLRYDYKDYLFDPAETWKVMKDSFA